MKKTLILLSLATSFVAGSVMAQSVTPAVSLSSASMVAPAGAQSSVPPASATQLSDMNSPTLTQAAQLYLQYGADQLCFSNQDYATALSKTAGLGVTDINRIGKNDWCVPLMSIAKSKPPTEVFKKMQPVGKYPLKIVFTVNKGLEKSCYDTPPPPLYVTLNRNHPARVSLLELKSSWPYSRAVILRSDAYNSTANKRYFTDQVTRSDIPVTMLLKGTASWTQAHETGTWTDSTHCSGNFTVYRQS